MLPEEIVIWKFRQMWLAENEPIKSATNVERSTPVHHAGHMKAYQAAAAITALDDV